MARDGKHVVETDRLHLAANDPPQTIAVGSADWLAWLADHDRFTFRHQGTHFTARREARRGGQYWYAYRRHQGQLHKVYLGRAAELTAAALIVAAGRLAHAATEALPDHTPPAHAAPPAPPADVARLTSNWLAPPTLPEHVIARPRLLGRLSQPIVLITAPSGYGKTTLLNQWQSTLDWPVAWVSLETEANTVYTFWTAVLLAWQAIEPGYDLPLTMLRSPTPPPIEHILPQWIEALRQSQTRHAGRRATLIIDNYQRVRSAAIDVSLRLFLDHLPPGVQVVLASQVAFSFDVQRWRGKGSLVELGQEELRLTPEEGLAYLEGLSPLTLTEREKVSLVVRADGWPAGLNLLLLALRQQGNLHEFVATFSGHDRYLQSYVAGEILAKHPPERRDFLLATSLLKLLTGPLCDALTGGDDGQATLAYLHESNQFVTLIDEARGWYQYHDLFAKALQDQLRAEQPQRVPDLHRRAAAWFLENDLFPEAVRHLLLSGEWQEVGPLIDQAIMSELRRGSDHRILRWLQQMPDELFVDHPSLPITFARLALFSLPHEQVVDRLGRVARLIEARPAGESAPAQRAALRWIQQWRANGTLPEPGAEFALSAEAACLWRVFSLRERASRLMRQEGSDSEGLRLMQEAAHQAEADGITFLAVSIQTYLVSHAMHQGRLTAAETMANDMLQWLRARSRRLPECASMIEFGLARIYLARNQLDRAQAALEQAAAIDPYPTSLNMAMLSHALQAHILQAQGQGAAARLALAAAHELSRYGAPVLSERDIRLHQALLLVRQNDLAAAEQLMRFELPPPANPNAPDHDLYGILWGEIYLWHGNYAAAETALTQTTGTRADVSSSSPLLAILLLALVYWGQDKTYQARHELLRAVRLAEPEGRVRPFLDCGRRLIPLLIFVARSASSTTAQRRFMEGILAELQAVYPDTPGLSADDFDRRTDAATISPREQELLKVLAEGLSNREIAGRLVLEESTIRTHLRNIYRKLNVNSRVQAIQRAREIGLI